MKKSELRKLIREEILNEIEEINIIDITNKKLSELKIKKTLSKNTKLEKNILVDSGEINPKTLKLFGYMFTEIKYTVNVFMWYKEVKNAYNADSKIIIDFRYTHPKGGTNGHTIIYFYSHLDKNWRII